jgi:hypothetical protein
MSAVIDHVGIPATDPEAAGSFLAWVLGEGSVVPDFYEFVVAQSAR